MAKPKPIRTVISLPAEFHAAVRMLAAARSTSMNAMVVKAVAQFVTTDEARRDIQHFIDCWRRGKPGRGIPDLDAEESEDDRDG